MNNITVGKFLTESSTKNKVYGAQPGMLRYNESTGVLEVLNNYNAWAPIGSNNHISLTYEAQCAIEWANQQRRKQEEYAKLAEECISVKDAFEQLTKAQEQLDIIVNLVKTHGEQNA